MKSGLIMLAILACTGFAYGEFVNHGVWSGRTYSDEMTDEITTDLMVSGSGGWSAGFRSVYLVVRFEDDSDIPIIFVQWGANVGTRNLRCLTRVDDDTAVEYQLSSGPNTTFVLTNHERKVLFAKLLSGGEFIVRFTPQGQSQLTMKFSLSGITAVAIDCGINPSSYTDLLE